MQMELMDSREMTMLKGLGVKNTQIRAMQQSVNRPVWRRKITLKMF